MSKARSIPGGTQPLLRAPLLAHLSADDRYLVAVSGGRDSVALLHLLREHGFGRLVICHLNHRLRGRSSAADARFVRQLAARMSLPIEEAEADVVAFARERKLSIETAARAVRYAFFVTVSRRRRCPRIFLGHHADDQVETFLMNLFRGAGPAGLKAMRERSTHVIGDSSLTVFRPLLGIWRADIEQFVAARRFRFREDASNQQLDALRNRIRRRIIPYLQKQVGRDVRKTVLRAALIAAEEDALLNQQVPVLTARVVVKQLREIPLALQRRALAQWLRSRGVVDVGFKMVERVRTLLHQELPAKVNLTGSRHVRRRAGELFIE